MPAASILLISIGLLFIAAGFLMSSGWEPWGRLPGDINISGERFTFYFPLATSLLLSAVLTGLFWILQRWR